MSKSQDASIISVRDRKLDLVHPVVMGILNATPDSFSDGGAFNDVENALGRIGLMISQGAGIIDIGGESTRPGSDPVTEEEEINRVMPILEKAILQFPGTLFSVDTTKFLVAKEALKLGAHFINDVSGLKKEPRFAGLCAKFNAGYILMHSQGNPKNMQQDPTYENVISDIYHFFEKQLSKAKADGAGNIIIDPGIGFGKTLDHNLKILGNLAEFTKLGHPVMIGASRKSMIGKLLGGRPVDDRVTGTVALHYHAMMQGANIIRVHDVKEASDSIEIFKAIRERSGKQ